MNIKMIQKGGEEKILPLNEMAAAAFRDLRPGKDAIGPEEAEKYIFLNEQTKKPVTNVRYAILRACKKAGIVKKVHPHLFRHSLATHFLGADVNLRTIQTYLGHASADATEWYTHVVTGHLKNATDKIFAEQSAKSEV